jgi:hypothetical protein
MQHISLFFTTHILIQTNCTDWDNFRTGWIAIRYQKVNYSIENHIKKACFWP